MTWEIVAGIITLGGALMGIAKIISNNTKAMTEIRCSVETLNTSFSEQREDLRTMHQDLLNLKDKVKELEIIAGNRER